MKAGTWRRQQGMTLLEFTLIAIIMAALIALALQRIASVRVYMERAAVEYNESRLREVLALEFARMVVENRLRTLPDERAMNPLRMAAIERYAGTRELPAESRRDAGQWYYDTAIDTVVYVPRFPEALQWPEGESRLLRWRVVPRWNDVDDDGRFREGVDRLTALELVREDRATWK